MEEAANPAVVADSLADSVIEAALEGWKVGRGGEGEREEEGV